jgi:hypothetical protein
MKIPLKWLADYVPLTLSVAELARRLTLAASGCPSGAWATSSATTRWTGTAWSLAFVPRAAGQCPCFVTIHECSPAMLFCPAFFPFFQ